jgi:hypothetical protein
MLETEPAGKITNPGSGLLVRAYHNGVRIEPARAQKVSDCRRRREVLGLAAWKDIANIPGTMQMGVNRDDAIEISRKKLADDLLADRLAFMES